MIPVLGFSLFFTAHVSMLKTHYLKKTSSDKPLIILLPPTAFNSYLKYPAVYCVLNTQCLLQIIVELITDNDGIWRII